MRICGESDFGLVDWLRIHKLRLTARSSLSFLFFSAARLYLHLNALLERLGFRSRGARNSGNLLAAMADATD